MCKDTFVRYLTVDYVVWLLLQRQKQNALQRIICKIQYIFPKFQVFYTMKCACCGADMLPDRELESTIIYKCKECGISDSRLKDIGE